MGFPKTGYFKELYNMYETVRLVHPNPVVIDEAASLPKKDQNAAENALPVMKPCTLFYSLAS